MLDNFQQPSQAMLEAADFICKGGIGGVPTETVYGLAANALNPQAVRKIFEAKGRPFIDPLIVHVCDMDMAESIAVMDADAKKLAGKILAGSSYDGSKAQKLRSRHCHGRVRYGSSQNAIASYNRPTNKNNRIAFSSPKRKSFRVCKPHYRLPRARTAWR